MISRGGVFGPPPGGPPPPPRAAGGAPHGEGPPLAAPRAVEAQPAGKVYRVGLISAAAPLSEMAGPEPLHPFVRAFVQGLRILGYVEGQNLILGRRSAEGRYERFGDIVAELVRLKMDVIVTFAHPAAQA